MDLLFKADNIAKAVRQLPAPKTYPAEMVTVAVGKLKYNFEKFENQWFLIIK
jgi:hypothetical protein